MPRKTKTQEPATWTPKPFPRWEAKWEVIPAYGDGSVGTIFADRVVSAATREVEAALAMHSMHRCYGEPLPEDEVRITTKVIL